MNARADQHISGELLRAFSSGRLDDAAAAAVVAHLKGCPQCCQKPRS
jgi:hypothetical protein